MGALRGARGRNGRARLTRFVASAKNRQRWPRLKQCPRRTISASRPPQASENRHFRLVIFLILLHSHRGRARIRVLCVRYSSSLEIQTIRSRHACPRHPSSRFQRVRSGPYRSLCERRMNCRRLGRDVRGQRSRDRQAARAGSESRRGRDDACDRRGGGGVSDLERQDRKGTCRRDAPISRGCLDMR